MVGVKGDYVCVGWDSRWVVGAGFVEEQEVYYDYGCDDEGEEKVQGKESG